MSMYRIETGSAGQERISAEIDAYLNGAGRTDSMYVVEKTVDEFTRRMGLELVKRAVAMRGTGKTEEEVIGRDGRALPYHGLRTRKYLSVFGELEIERAYYWRDGREGVFPLDASLDLPRRRCSYLLEEWTQALVADMPYDAAIGAIERIRSVKLWKRGLEDRVLESAAKAGSFAEAKEAPDPATEGPVLCASVDGKGVRMVPSERPAAAAPAPKAPHERSGKEAKRQGSRSEAVVTGDHSFRPEARTAEEVVDSLMHASTEPELQRQRRESRARRARGEPAPREPLNKTASACMYGKKKAIGELADRLAARNPSGTKPVAVLMDGDVALERTTREEFAGRGWLARAVFILDILHVLGYLWKAGTALHGANGAGRKPWVRKQLLSILRGRTGRVVGALRQTLTKRGKSLSEARKDELRKVIVYLDNHRHMMRYDEYLAAGYPIATGVVEGLCNSLVKERMDKSGAQWTKAGAQAVLHLRAVKQNGDWDAFQKHHRECERMRLYYPCAA